MEAYKSKTKEVLKALLKDKGLETTGTKETLIKRLISAHPVSVISDDNDTEDSVSHVSSVSSPNFSKTQRNVEAARRAELETRTRVLKEKQLLLQEELRLKLRQEQLDLEEEIAVCNAREISFAANDGEENGNEEIDLMSNHQAQLPGPSAQSPHAGVGIDSKPYEMHLQKLTEAMLCQQRRNLLPKTEIKKFGGDPMAYPMFIRSFNSRIERETDSDSERLYFLQQCTTGKPHEIVTGYMHLQPDVGYKNARAALHRKYGDEHRISAAYVDKILSWPPLKSMDVDILEDFSILKRSCKMRWKLWEC